MFYLERFRIALEERWRGSLVCVREARSVDPNAKEYLAALARKGIVERVIWGWYWIPGTEEGFWGFLARDQHEKYLERQTAAGVWNQDFVHRDIYRIAVRDESYARALRAFCQSRGWSVIVETRSYEPGDFVRIGNLFVESLEATIVDCIKEWAFVDAFAALYEHRDNIAWDKISRHGWERIPRTKTRVGQVMKYGTAMMGREKKTAGFPRTKSRINDPFVRRQVDEAVEKVASFG